MTQFASKPTIAIVGMGYVGLPLAMHFSKHFSVIGFDIDEKKIKELKEGHDRRREATVEEMRAVKVAYTTNPSEIDQADLIIVAVPTPVDGHNVPDLTPLTRASAIVAKHLKRGAIVVYESTVYPGVTEDICVPILEKDSGMHYGKDFFVGYSPERINPGDELHSLENVVKVVSGSTPEVATYLAQIYGTVVRAGIHVAPTIKVAEAEKIVENIQRDINIALVNELAILFDRLGINIHDVLAAAGTKWNFHNYTPGLVGGHCISIDPYYLTHKAVEVNYHPNIILSGRRINDRMHSFYAQKTIKEMNKRGIATSKAKIAVLGLTFKENCADCRNSRAEHLIAELRDYGAHVFGIDPWLDADAIRKFKAEPATIEDIHKLGIDAIVIATPHKEFFNIDYSSFPVVIDIKGLIVKR